MTDFESAEMAAFCEVFLGIENKACLFHFAQNLLKRVRKEELINRYYHDEGIRQSLRGCIGLAFLPIGMVRKGFSILINEAPMGIESVL